MNELTTVFKFVGEGNGAATGSATSSVATGDITMLIAGIVVLLIGAFAVWATVAYRKRAAVGAHASEGNKMYMPLIGAVVAIILGLGLTLASTSSIKAHAEGAITTTPCIGTVDEETGSVTFSDITMTNNSEDTQLINDFNFKAAEGVTGLNDVVWTFEAETIYGEETLFKGKFGDPVEEGWLPLPMDAGFTSTISVSATGISPEVAKSLIGKDVAYETSIYDALYTVSASVDDGSHGNITYSTESSVGLDLPNGVTYAVDKDDANIITFGTGEHAQTIKFVPAEGYKLKNWTLNGDVITEGTVKSNLAFVANTESAVTDYNGTIMLSGIDGASGPASGVTVQFTYPDSNTEPVTADTDSNGKYTLTGVSAGIVGTVSIADPDSQKVKGDAYEQESISTTLSTGASLDTMITRKLTSLAVTVKSNGGDLSTHWCPAFTDSALSKANVIFYDSVRCEITGSGEKSGNYETYKMDDLNKKGTIYYAFVTTGVTLKCYQTTDATWNNTFIAPETTPGTSSSLKDDFISLYCPSDPAAKTVYFDGTETEKFQWAPSSGSEPSGTPTLNGVSYSTDKGKGGWYAAYGGSSGGVLSYFSSLPWSAVASSSSNVYDWRIIEDLWQDTNLIYPGGVVLSQTFSS